MERPDKIMLRQIGQYGCTAFGAELRGGHSISESEVRTMTLEDVMDCSQSTAQTAVHSRLILASGIGFALGNV